MIICIWIFQGYVSYYGVSRGDPYRFIYGTDSWGNICNRDNEAIPEAPYSGKNMIGRT